MSRTRAHQREVDQERQARQALQEENQRLRQHIAYLEQAGAEVAVQRDRHRGNLEMLVSRYRELNEELVAIALTRQGEALAMSLKSYCLTHLPMVYARAQQRIFGMPDAGAGAGVGGTRHEKRRFARGKSNDLKRRAIAAEPALGEPALPPSTAGLAGVKADELPVAEAVDSAAFLDALVADIDEWLARETEIEPYLPPTDTSATGAARVPDTSALVGLSLTGEAARQADVRPSAAADEDPPVCLKPEARP